MVERVKPLGVLRSHRGSELVVACHGVIDARTNLCPELLREPHRVAVVLGDCCLQDLYGYVREVTGALLATDTEEVVVLPTASPFGALDDESLLAPPAASKFALVPSA